MTSSRIDRQMASTALLAERLAKLLPDVRVHVATEVARARVEAGWPSSSRANGAVEFDNGKAVAPTVKPSAPLEGRCKQDDEDDPSERCLHDRPCPVHDRPVSLTSVERAADQALRIEQWYADLVAQQRVIALTVAEALRSCEKLLGMRVTGPRCSSAGREGAEIPRADGGWSDPACEQTAEKSGLCDACYMREYRWRQRVGLRARDRTDEVM